MGQKGMSRALQIGRKGTGLKDEGRWCEGIGDGEQ